MNTIIGNNDATKAASLPKLNVFLSPKSKSSSIATGLANFSKISKFAVKLKRKATAAKERLAKSPKSSSLPPRFVHPPTNPVKYEERPARTYRRTALNKNDVPSLSDLDIARYGVRPQATAYPEFDGKIQLPPVTLSTTSFYQTPEERSLPKQFLKPAHDRLSTEGMLFTQDMPDSIFYPVYGFIDIMVPVFFCFETFQKQSAIHVRDIRGHSSKIIGWRTGISKDNSNLRLFCFEIHSLKNIGTGNELLTFGTVDREVAFKWLNYVRRASQQYSNSEDSSMVALSGYCPIAPPPTRRNQELWPSFKEVAQTKISMREKNNAVSSQQIEQRPEELRTVQHILLDVGLVMDEKWAGGPATVFTIEDRAAQHLQTWYRFVRDRFFVHGPHGLVRNIWAARTVQKSLRGWRIRRRLQRTKVSATVIQRHWRKHRLARNILKAKQDMDQKLVRAKAYFLDIARMKVIRIWREMADKSLRAKDICRRVLGGVLQHTFDRWCDFREFRLAVKREKFKQEQKEKNRRAKFFIKKMVYRHAATAIQSWKQLVEQNKRARGMLKRHLTGQLEKNFLSWADFVRRMRSARKLCKRVLLGVEKNRIDDWIHFIQGRIAARKIQTCWRRFTAYRNYLILIRWNHYADSCAYCIQSCWRIHKAWQTTWGSGGVNQKMIAARLIQTQWRGYVKRRDYQISLHKIRLLQERFRFWFHHRRAAVVFIQYQWRRYWQWKVAAMYASTLIQSHIRAYFVRMDMAYRKEEVLYSYQYDGVVLRGVVKIPDRYGAYHRVLCTAQHDSGTLRYVFVDPRTCTSTELFFRSMQLVQLTEERFSVRRHLRDIESLAQVVLDLVIVLGPGTSDPEYILRPKMMAAYSPTTATVVAYPLRSPRMATMHDILPTQTQFWDSVYEASALRKESRLPIGIAAQQLVLNTEKSKALRDTVLSINDYCGEDDVNKREQIAMLLTATDLSSLLAGKTILTNEDDDDIDTDSVNDDTIEQSNEESDEESEEKEDKEIDAIVIAPSIVLSHSFVLAKLLIGLHHAPIDIFDRVEHRAAEILIEHSKKATDAFGEFAQNRGMRPPTREATEDIVTSSTHGASRWGKENSFKQWEILLEEIMSEMHTSLDTTQQMETPFVGIRETFENAIIEQEYRRTTSCDIIQAGADSLFDYLANAGVVNSTTDMMIRARISTFIEQCESKIKALNKCGHIQKIYKAVVQFKSLEQMRSKLLDEAYVFEDSLVYEIESLAVQRRAFVAAYFAKKRIEIRVTESTLLETARRLHLFVLPELRKVINNCSSAAEDMKIVLFELGPALEEAKECARMHREDVEAWYAQQSISILSDRDALAAEIEAKKQARLKADLEEAERGGKSIEQVKKERLQREAANRIQRVYKAYLERVNDGVNAAGVWGELIYNGKLLVSCLDILVDVMETNGGDDYELAMIQSLQMRVHKLAQQIVLRNLGPCMKNAHVVEKRWPLVNGLMEKWAEEERMELLNEDDKNPNASFSSEEESDWDSEEYDSDDSEEDSETDSDDDEEDGGGGNTKTKAKDYVARSKTLPQEIHNKLRVLWRAHLAKQQIERERLEKIRAAQFGPRMKRKMAAGSKYVQTSIANSAPVKMVGRQFHNASAAIKQQLHSMDGYQQVKLAFGLFGYNHFPQYFSIPEGVKENGATKIQKRVRGMLARILAKKIAEDRDEKAFEAMLTSAAIKIQTLFRYFAARKYTLELVRVSYDKEFDDKAGKWCYHNTVADSYTYTKPPILGDALDLPTPRSKARGMKWSAEYYVEKSKKTKVVQRSLKLTNTVMHTCNHPSCKLMEREPNSFVQCPRCKVKFYCGRPHQLNHLDQHGPECEKIVTRNRESRAKKRAAKKMGVSESDLVTKIDNRDDKQRAKDKQTELFKLEKLIDSLKKGLITKEEYTFALRELKDL